MWIVTSWHKKPANNHIQPLFLLLNLSLITTVTSYILITNQLMFSEKLLHAIFRKGTICLSEQTSMGVTIS